jgi:hypothetical protein
MSILGTKKYNLFMIDSPDKVVVMIHPDPQCGWMTLYTSCAGPITFSMRIE